MSVETATPAPTPERVRSWRSLAAVISVLILAAAVGWFWHRHPAAPAETGAMPQVQTTLHLDPFVLNLADADERSYLRVGIDLGLDHELKREDPVPIAAVRDTILGVLADTTAGELTTAGGKTRLKQSLLEALHTRVPGLGVEEIYFTEFLIQR